MVTENDVVVCMEEKKFKNLDEIHCGLDDGRRVIDMNLERMRGTSPIPFDRQVDFIKCALDNIDGALADIAADQVPGFESVDMESTLKRTSSAMNSLQTAIRRGSLTDSEMSNLKDISTAVTRAKRIAFMLRAKRLTNCLL